MRHHIPAITAVVAALTIGLCVFARDNNRWDEEAQRRKAEMISALLCASVIHSRAYSSHFSFSFAVLIEAINILRIVPH